MPLVESKKLEEKCILQFERRDKSIERIWETEKITKWQSFSDEASDGNIDANTLYPLR